VPCVINNRGDRGSLGENDAILKLFGEPMLNNPVVRFVDSAGEVGAVLAPQALRPRPGCVIGAPALHVSQEGDVHFRFFRSPQAVAPRLENQWTPAAVFRGAQAALTAVGRPVPSWAESMVVPSTVGTAIFTMD
jgi:hypothetical protein